MGEGGGWGEMSLQLHTLQITVCVSSDSTNVSAPNKNTQQYASMQPITIMLLSLGDDCLMILKSKTVRLKDRVTGIKELHYPVLGN